MIFAISSYFIRKHGVTQALSIFKSAIDGFNIGVKNVIDYLSNNSQYIQ